MDDRNWRAREPICDIISDLNSVGPPPCELAGDLSGVNLLAGEGEGVQVVDKVFGHLVDDLAHELELPAGEGGRGRVSHLRPGLPFSIVSREFMAKNHNIYIYICK